MKRRKLRTALLLTALSLVVLAAALGVSTYAWFTFDPYTNVTPLEGQIADGDTNLLIAASPDGPFDKQCALQPTDLPAELRPVSTADLSQFYAATSQDKEGYSITFRNVTGRTPEYLIHGTVYLQCVGGGCDVYFQSPPLYLGADGQVLAAGRLGLKITGGTGAVQTYLFRLDALGNTAGAASRQTVREKDVVVGGLHGMAAAFTRDPAVPVEGYFINTGRRTPLCSLEPDEIAAVEYWVYLEGCDPECCNPVQSRDLALQLGFAGEPREN